MLLCTWSRDALSCGIRSTILLNDGRIAEINGSSLISLDVLFPHCTHILLSAYLHVNACSRWPNPSPGLLFKKHTQALLFLLPPLPPHPPPLPYLQDHTVSLPETFTIAGLAEDLSAHSSGMAHSVSDSNFSQY